MVADKKVVCMLLKNISSSVLFLFLENAPVCVLCSRKLLYVRNRIYFINIYYMYVREAVAEWLTHLLVLPYLTRRLI